MKTNFSLILLIPFLIFSQEETDTTIVEHPDLEADFPGGPQAMKQFIADNVIYPEDAMINNEQGRVYIEFIVNTDGSLAEIKTLKGVSEEINNEGIRVVGIMPKWTPAMFNGVAVRAKCRIPINFVLENSNRKSRKEKRKRNKY